MKSNTLHYEKFKGINLAQIVSKKHMQGNTHSAKFEQLQKATNQSSFKKENGYVSNLNIKDLSANRKPWKKVRPYFHNKGLISSKFLLIKR